MERFKNSEKHPRPQTPKTPPKPRPSEPIKTPLRESPQQPPKAKPVPDRPKRPGNK